VAVTTVEAELAGQGRLLIRPSGTEPLVRVMVEAKDATQAQACAERLAQVIRRA
jgi:phosphoglucosamine mutase